MDFTSGILSVTGINATGHIFASYPARHLSVLGGFVDQVSDPMTPDRPPTTNPPTHPRALPKSANVTLIVPVGGERPSFAHFWV